MTLQREGLDVIGAQSGEESLRILAERPFDVILLDLMLPGMDGFEVCREIRRISSTPVIMVTARADSHDVVAGLEAGADDYITKPFVAKELSARIRALARRTRGAEPRPRITVGDLEVAPQDGTVTRDGVLLQLTKTEFRLLSELVAEGAGCTDAQLACSSGAGGHEPLKIGLFVAEQVARPTTKMRLPPCSRPGRSDDQPSDVPSRLTVPTSDRPGRCRTPTWRLRWIRRRGRAPRGPGIRGEGWCRGSRRSGQ